MYNIIICDNNYADLERLSKCVDALVKKHQISSKVTLYQSAIRLVGDLEASRITCDLIILDIVLKGISGIEIAKLISRRFEDAEIIFVSYNKEYVFDALDLFPTQYFLKGKIKKESFEKAFLRSFENFNRKTRKNFICKFNDEIRVIPLERISYFEIYQRQITVYYNHHDSFMFYGSLNQVMQTLNDTHFVRCHRSIIVNLTKIVSLNSKFIRLTSGKDICLGRSYKNDIKNRFIAYIDTLSV